MIKQNPNPALLTDTMSSSPGPQTRPSQKPPFDLLPDEILLEILKLATCFDSHSRELDLDDTTQLYLVCQRFARILSPLLYARYDHTTFESGTLYLQTLAQNPDLGKQLKSLVSLRPKGSLSEEHLGALARGIEAEHLDGSSNLRSALLHFKLRWRVSDAQVALIMLKAARLEELEIIEWTDLYPYGVPFWLQVLRRDPASFARLRFLAVEWKLSLQEVMALFKLPALHTLELRRIEDPPGGMTPELKNVVRCESLRSLRFIGCELRPEALAACLRACSRLETFQYMYDRCVQAYDFITHFDEANLTALWSAVFQHRGSLKTLCMNWTLLETDVALFQGGVGAGLPNGLLNFTRFEELEYLDLPLDLVRLSLACGKDSDHLVRRLPKTLQTLHVNRTDNLEHVQEELTAVAYAKRHHFPELKDVHLENQNYVVKEEWTEVEEAFEKVGTAFRVESLYSRRLMWEEVVLTL